MEGVEGAKDFEEVSLEGTDIGLSDLIELLDSDSDSSKLLGSFTVFFNENDSEKENSMFSNVEFSLLFGKSADTKVAGIFKTSTLEGNRNRTPGLRKLSSGVALRCGPEGFLRER